MSRLLLNITLDPGSDSWQVTDAIQAALTRQPGVAAAEAQPSELRFGVAEATLAVSAAVVLVKSGREAIEEARRLVKSLTELLRDIKGVKDVFVEVVGTRKRLDQLNDADIAALASSEART
jgi:Cu/Ag efflux pump CusA